MTKILVVDDDRILAEGVADLLAMHDFETETAWDCETAEAMMASEFYPVILADLRLRTDDDGFRLIESIRRISPRTSVAAMSGRVTAEDEKRLHEIGAHLVLHKPVPADTLIEVITAMIAEVESAASAADLDDVYRSTVSSLQAIARGRFRFDPDDAQELIQEAWCLFLEKRQSIDKPKAWLTGTVANLCRQEIGRRVRARERAGEMPERTTPGTRAEVLALQQALGRLDPRSRILCEMIGLEQRPYEEVSAAVGIAIGSVGPMYIRAKERLRRSMSN